MPTEPRQHLADWLRDAYAMENQALEMCERQSERLQSYPKLQERIAQHVEETKNQIAKLDKCFEILGEKPSILKNATGWTMGNLQAAAGMLMTDEVIKGSIASYVFENLEIAMYGVIMTAAITNNQPEIAKICEEILQEEQAMAEFLKTNLPATTEKFLSLDMTDQRARA